MHLLMKWSNIVFCLFNEPIYCSVYDPPAVASFLGKYCSTNWLEIWTSLLMWFHLTEPAMQI